MVRVSVAAAVVIAVIFALLFSPIFRIKSAEFSNGQTCLSDPKQLEKYQVIGQNILFFKSSQLSQNLKNDFSCIDQVTIKKQFPRTLKIEATSQRPVAKIDGADLTVTKDGAVSQSQQTNLPTIFLPSETFSASGASAKDAAKEGQKINDSVTLFALDVISQLQKSDFIAQNIRVVDGGDVAVYNTYGTIALFTSAKPAGLQVDSLQAILAKAKIDQNKIARIDLRFDKPVIFARQTP